MRLFDLELEDQDLDAAGRVLEAPQAHDENAFVLARAVQLAQLRGDRPAADTALDRLGTDAPGESEWPLWAADRAYRDAGFGRQAEAIYARALDRPDVHPQVGSLWVEHCASRRHWRCARRLDALLAQGEVGRRALAAYLDALTRARAAWRIPGCIRRYRRVLRTYTLGWGTVGFALTTLVRHRTAVDWLRDWPERERVQPWMLINLVLALRARRQAAEANRVSRHALGLKPDYTTPYHQAWLGLDDLLDGEGREAADRLAGIDPASFDQTNRYLFQLARILLERAQAQPQPADRHLAGKSARRALASLTRKSAIPPEDHGAVLHTYQRAVDRLARDRGRVAGLLWKLARRLQAPRVQR